jgi:hypothetical protein
MNDKVSFTAVRKKRVNAMSLTLAFCGNEKMLNAHHHPELRGRVLNYMCKLSM